MVRRRRRVCGETAHFRENALRTPRARPGVVAPRRDQVVARLAAASHQTVDDADV